MPYVGRLISGTGIRWLLFYLFVLIAWALLFSMAFTSTELRFTRIYGAEFWAEICEIDASDTGFAPIFLMWLVMSAAMMAPTFFPSLQVFDDLTHHETASATKFVCLIAGYLAVWVGFSTLAAGMQIIFSDIGWVAGSQSTSTSLNAALLIGAGWYQFTYLKDTCLSKCRQPLTFFMQHWESGPLRMGLRLGIICLGCCWALMLLGFVGGLMNLLWMGAATLFMILEKLPEIGRFLTKPLGYLLIISGAIVALI